jgi:hypothetical protein
MVMQRKRQRRTIKLGFSDFWAGFRYDDNHMYHLLGKYYDVVLDDEPDYLIYSGFGRRFLTYDCTRIFWTGECTPPDFSECDYAFTHEYLDHPRHYRLPLYGTYHDARDPMDPYSPQRLIEPKPPVEALLAQKTKFCCALISNARAPERLRFMEKLSKYKKVDSGGKVANNIGHVVPHTVNGKNGKLEFIKDYKFVLAFENQSHPGYTTEKIYEPMTVHSIPLYWGDPCVGRDFNIRSFVNCSDDRWDAAIERIIAIDSSEDEYRAMLREPYFNGNVVNEFIKEDNVIQQFHRIFSAPRVRTWRRSVSAAAWRASRAVVPEPVQRASAAVRNRARDTVAQIRCSVSVRLKALEPNLHFAIKSTLDRQRIEGARFTPSAATAEPRHAGVESRRRRPSDTGRIVPPISDVWYCVPSCNPRRAREATAAWREMGYRVALLVDRNRLGDFIWGEDAPDLVVETQRYPGYYRSVNLLAGVLRRGTFGLRDGGLIRKSHYGVSTPPAVVVTGGDDMFPDEKLSAHEIRDTLYAMRPDGWFVAQPIGDVAGMPGTDKICGSPWFGAAWLERGYGGQGPFCGDYFHFYGDEELKNVSVLTGAYVELPNICQRHEHYRRQGGPKKTAYQARNETRYWTPDQRIFNERKSKGWPGHEPVVEIAGGGSVRLERTRVTRSTDPYVMSGDGRNSG